MAIYRCSCAAGAAAAGGQAGQREPGCRPEHHREIHLPPQVQEGERPKTASRLPAPLSWPRVVGTERTEEGCWWVAILRVGKLAPSIEIFPQIGEECKIQNRCFNILWGSRAEAVV